MKRNPLWIDIPGLPEAQGSARAFVVGGRARITSSNKKLMSWRRDAIVAAAEAKGARPMLIDWVELDLEFRFPRPAGHFGTGRNAGVLKTSAPYFKTSKPDLDKLARAVLDALTGAGIYRDDGQVASLRCCKTYVMGDAPGVKVVVFAHEWDRLTESEAA